MPARIGDASLAVDNITVEPVENDATLFTTTFRASASTTPPTASTSSVRATKPPKSTSVNPDNPP